MKTHHALRNYTSLLAAVFMPWQPFWAQHKFELPDHFKLKVAFSDESKNCNIVKNIYNVEIVRTETSRAKGLGGKNRKLKDNEGMLFLFESEEPLSFWMKDTYIPLDIAYMNSKGEVTQVLSMPVEKNPQNPTATFPSKYPSAVALEVKMHQLKKLEVHDQKKTPWYLCIEDVFQNRKQE